MVAQLISSAYFGSILKKKLFQSFSSNHDLFILRVRYFQTVLQRRSYVLCIHSRPRGSNKKGKQISTSVDRQERRMTSPAKLRDAS